MKLVGQILLGLLIVAVLVTAVQAFGMATYGWVLPWQKSIERQAVKQSESFVNSQSDSMSTDMTQYAGLEVQLAQANTAGDTGTATAIKGQENMIISQMCIQLHGMAKNTINPAYTSFVASHGGCQ